MGGLGQALTDGLAQFLDAFAGRARNGEDLGAMSIEEFGDLLTENVGKKGRI